MNAHLLIFREKGQSKSRKHAHAIDAFWRDEGYQTTQARIFRKEDQKGREQNMNLTGSSSLMDARQFIAFYSAEFLKNKSNQIRARRKHMVGIVKFSRNRKSHWCLSFAVCREVAKGAARNRSSSSFVGFFEKSRSGGAPHPSRLCAFWKRGKARHDFCFKRFWKKREIVYEDEEARERVTEGVYIPIPKA
jgi:hypothetical protein